MRATRGFRPSPAATHRSETWWATVCGTIDRNVLPNAVGPSDATRAPVGPAPSLLACVVAQPAGAGGMSTASITWMMPFDVFTSTTMTFAGLSVLAFSTTFP